MSAVQSFKIKDDHIKLGQVLKAAGMVESGVDAKYAILDGLVKVNGNVELQRGKKALSGRCGGISGRNSENRVRAVNGYQITGVVKFQKFQTP